MNLDTLAVSQRLKAAGLTVKVAEAIATELTGSKRELFAKKDGEALVQRIGNKIILNCIGAAAILASTAAVMMALHAL
ncbi:hypothetical protein BH10PSE5_BH10PSE5_11620 [soil metagenome]